MWLLRRAGGFYEGSGNLVAVFRKNFGRAGAGCTKVKGASRKNPRFWLPVLFPSIFYSFHSIHALTNAFPAQISERNLHPERKQNAMLEIPNALEKRFQVLKVWK